MFHQFLTSSFFSVCTQTDRHTDTGNTVLLKMIPTPHVHLNVIILRWTCDVQLTDKLCVELREKLNNMTEMYLVHHKTLNKGQSLRYNWPVDQQDGT